MRLQTPAPDIKNTYSQRIFRNEQCILKRKLHREQRPQAHPRAPAGVAPVLGRALRAGRHPARRQPARGRAARGGAGVAVLLSLKLAKLAELVFELAIYSVFFAKFAIFWRARSRLYQNEILQENIRLTAFPRSTRCARFCTALNPTF